MKVTFKEWDCNLVFGEYVSEGNPYIQLVDVRDGLPVATATVNPSVQLEKGQVCIKDYSENEGMLQTLMDAGLVSAPVDYIPMGFVRVPVCQFLVKPFIEEKIDSVFRVNWKVEEVDFTTWEFVTLEDVYIAESDSECDLFRLFIYKDHEMKPQIYEANSEDYDTHETVTHLFDLEKIMSICEAAKVPDATKEYKAHYEKRKPF